RRRARAFVAFQAVRGRVPSRRRTRLLPTLSPRPARHGAGPRSAGRRRKMDGPSRCVAEETVGRGLIGYDRRMVVEPSGTTELAEWLLHAPRVEDGGLSFVQNLAERLRAIGMPLWRVSMSLLTKHPEVRWRNLRWHETEGAQVIQRQHQTSFDPFFTESPVALLVQGYAPIRVRLTGDSLPFPICRDLKEQGGTDYYAQGLTFSNGDISYVSWATREPSGFSDELLRALD